MRSVIGRSLVVQVKSHVGKHVDVILLHQHMKLFMQHFLRTKDSPGMLVIMTMMGCKLKKVGSAWAYSSVERSTLSNYNREDVAAAAVAVSAFCEVSKGCVHVGPQGLPCEAVGMQEERVSSNSHAGDPLH